MPFTMKQLFADPRSVSPPLQGVRTHLVVFVLVVLGDAVAVGLLLAPVAEAVQIVVALVAIACSVGLARAAFAASLRTRALAGQTERLKVRLAASEAERRELDHSNRMEALRSSTDELTGLLNRRALKSGIRNEANRAVRHARPLAFLFLDVDRFKRINDEHGHAVGDEVLVGVALRVRSAVRSYDLFGRWGGDEFCLVAPEHRLPADTRALAEHLREAVSSAPFDTLSGSLDVTVSIGAVLVDPPTSTPEEMCALADAALYRAKRAGRNRVEVDEPARRSGPPGDR